MTQYFLIKLATIHQNIVTEDQSKAVMPSKDSKPFKKSDLPEGLNYDVFCHTVIPTLLCIMLARKTHGTGLNLFVQ